MKNSITIILTSIAFVSCLKYESRPGIGSAAKDSLIVFYNLAEVSRSEIAESLEKINSFGPKLIAIEVIFDELKDKKEDSVLSATLRRLRNVVFSADIGGFSSPIERTNSVFKPDGSQEGVLSYIVDEDGTTSSYIPLFQNYERQMDAFPDIIVYNFRPETLSRFEKMNINKPVRINFQKGIEQFHKVDRQTLTEELIQDKIVIVGPMEPKQDDYYDIVINDRKTKTFTQVITANIMLMILSEHRGNTVTRDD